VTELSLDAQIGQGVSIISVCHMARLDYMKGMCEHFARCFVVLVNGCVKGMQEEKVMQHSRAHGLKYLRAGVANQPWQFRLVLLNLPPRPNVQWCPG
jgi:hypothetical protein